MMDKNKTRTLPVLPQGWDVVEPPIRSSALHTLEECPRKFLYRERFGLVSYANRPALDIGSTFHQFLQNHYDGMSPDVATRTMIASHNEAKDKLSDQADKTGFLPGGFDLQKTLADMDMSFYKGLAMGTIFTERFPLSGERYPTLIGPDMTPYVEKLVQTNRLGDGLTFQVPVVAQFDRVVMDPDRNDCVWIVDHKTTSMSPVLRAQALSLSPQAKLYHYLLDAHLNNMYYSHKDRDFPLLKVRGIIHNVIRTPSIKYCKKDKSFEDYIARVAQWYRDGMDQNPNDPPMVQSFTRVKGTIYSDTGFVDRLRRLEQASIGTPDTSQYWQAGDYTCHTFNSPCPYLRLCLTQEPLWPTIIESEYKQEFRDSNPNGVTN